MQASAIDGTLDISYKSSHIQNITKASWPLDLADAKKPNLRCVINYQFEAENIFLVEEKMWRPFWYLLFNSLAIDSFPVFSYKSSTVAKKSPSYAFLTENVPLPDTFVLCSSIKQARFDDVGFYTINGKDSEEWFGLEFRTYSKETKLTARRGKNIHSLGKLLNPRLDYWYHICLGFDLGENSIKVAVNGNLLGKTLIDVTNVPSKLIMKLGVGYKVFNTNQQFHGSVANLQMFNGGNVTVLSRSPCHTWPVTLLSWNPNNWKVNGYDWVLTEELEDIFCNISEKYNLAIQSTLTMQESLDICKNKLNNSVIPFEEDHALFLKYMKWHVNTTGGACFYIWTPFSDEQSEGTFVNMNNNATTKIHPWSETEPNGGRDENFVVISVDRESLVDVPEKTLSCSSCQISSLLLLKLDGLCKHSLIGNSYNMKHAINA